MRGVRWWMAIALAVSLGSVEGVGQGQSANLIVPQSVPRLDAAVAYLDILEKYAGSPELAIRDVLTWWQSGDRQFRRISLELNLRAHPSSPFPARLRRALIRAAALHADAGVTLAKQARLNDAIEQFSLARSILGLPQFREVLDRRTTDLPRLVRLAEVWSLQGALQLHLVEPRLAELGRQYPQDADVLRTCGTVAEAHLLSIVRGPLRESYWEARPRAEWTRASKPRELAQASDCYERAHAVDPGDAETLVRLGRVRFLRGAWDEARSALLAALERPAPAYVRYWCHLFLGAVESARREEASAARHYREALAIAPRAQSPMLALSAASARAGDWRSARHILQPALEGPRRLDDDPWQLYAFGESHRLDGLVDRVRALIRLPGGDA
jgi:tetratricopeptide (TPR) repeat protein